MRVGMVTPEIASGYGWARYALELAAGLKAHGVEVVALTQPDPAPVWDGIVPDDLRPVLPHLVPPRRGFLLRCLLAVPRVRRALRDCEVVHIVAEPYAPLAAWAAGSRPLVVTAHGTYVPQTLRRPWVGGLYRRAYRQARLIAVSEYTAEQVRLALPGCEPVVIHNGVNVAWFQQPAPVPDKRGPTILATGGVKARKGTHLLVEALAVVREIVPDAQLVVTGSMEDAQYLDRLRERIAALGLQDAVHLTGRVGDDELRGWYQHADVFALPALNVGDRFEGFGLVFLEASACGLPVIGTSGSGAAEAVINGETGLLVRQDDPASLAGALVRLLTDPELCARLGSAGYAYAQTQSWNEIAGRVAALYAETLA